MNYLGLCCVMRSIHSIICVGAMCCRQFSNLELDWKVLMMRRGPWQFLEALTWENYRESMLHNVKENELQNVLNWRNMAFNSSLGCLETVL